MNNIQKFFLPIAIVSALLSGSCDKKPVDPPVPQPCDTCDTNTKCDTCDTTFHWGCRNPAGTAPAYLRVIGCRADFDTLASVPLDATIPGCISGKTIIDLEGGNKLYFQNSKKYEIHYLFAKDSLSGRGLPGILNQAEFNRNYYSPLRRFLCGAVTRYEGPKIWAYEIAPYDNADTGMIHSAYKKIADSCYFGDSLYFHPTSQTIEQLAKTLPSSVKIITTDELYAGVDYQPLNLATGMGKLVFITAASLAAETTYISFRDIVVLDEVPNDISVTAGIITQMFQTPLAHINVLSQNRKTPNMALRGAFTNSTLRSLEGKWVKLTVGISDWSITEVAPAVADSFWDKNRPETVGIPNIDTTVTDLRDAEKVLDIAGKGLGPALKAALPAFGGKASHFSAFPHMDSSKVPYIKAFVVPVYYYCQFMKQNGFDKKVDAFLADSTFTHDAATRDAKLGELRDSMLVAPIDQTFITALMAKITAEYPITINMRFRSSTNAEDLDGFTGAGLYTSESGNPNKVKSISNAIRTVWASVWRFRAFEERSYRNIDHKAVAMALLCHHAAPDEEAQGVAITANPYDPTGVEPAFYINAQAGSASVVLPDQRITSDQFIYYYAMTGQPTYYIARSNLISDTTHVLTKDQVRKLGIALEAIHEFFLPLYGKDKTKFYGMDTEFKFDQPVGDPNGKPVLYMKQCRPYPGMGK